MKTIKDKKEIAKALDMDVHIKDGGVVNIKSLAPKVTKIVNMEDKGNSDEYEDTELYVFGDNKFNTIQKSFWDWLKNEITKQCEEQGVTEDKLNDYMMGSIIICDHYIEGALFPTNFDQEIFFDDFDIDIEYITGYANFDIEGEEVSVDFNIKAKDQILANSKRLFYKK